MNIVSYLRSLLPMSRKTVDRLLSEQQATHNEAIRQLELEHSQRMRHTREECERQIAEAKATADEIIKQLHTIHFEQRGKEYYAVVVKFDTRMMKHELDRAALDFIAGRVGRMVSNEIASCRFVLSANDTIRRELDDTKQYELRRPGR